MGMTLNRDFLDRVGLGSLDAQTADELLGQIYEALAEAVGLELVAQLTGGQLTVLENLSDIGDEPSTEAWFEQEFPHFRKVVARQFEMMRDELIRQAPAILDEPSRGFIRPASSATPPPSEADSAP